MTEPNAKDIIHTRIWEEEPDPNNPFAAQACYCRGYDVYGDLLEKASYPEYLYLLFRGERPTPEQARTLEILAIAIANPGPRDPSVHAAMASGVGGSPAAASLMAALAVGAGVSGGAREVYQCMQVWERANCDLPAWRNALAAPVRPGKAEVWPDAGHAPGFEPYATSCRKPVMQTLHALAAINREGKLAWLQREQKHLESCAGMPLGMTGVIAAALSDLGFAPAAGEMFSLLLRLPGAAIHALEQWEQGFRRFPFFSIEIENDPGPAGKRTKDAP